VRKTGGLTDNSTQVVDFPLIDARKFVTTDEEFIEARESTGEPS
jgi:hypothetical protein